MPIEKSRLLTTGSRRHPRPDLVKRVFDITYTRFAPYILVHGNCPSPKWVFDPVLEIPKIIPESVDMVAEKWANLHGIQTEPHSADWNQFGLRAGPMRNQEMINLGAEVVFAFPAGKSIGTRGCIKMAQKANIPVWVFELVESKNGKVKMVRTVV